MKLLTLLMFLSSMLISSVSFATLTDAEEEKMLVALDQAEERFEKEYELFEKDQDQFLRKMIDEPIDYKLLNAKLEKLTDSVTKNSSVVKDSKFIIKSVLTGKAHKAATVGNKFPRLPYSLPFAETSVTLDVNFTENESMPLNGLGLNLEVGQTLFSIRGLVSVRENEEGNKRWAPGWADEYKGTIRLKVDTLEALQKIGKFKSIKSYCSSDDVVTRGLEDIIEKYPKVLELVEEVCGVIANVGEYTEYSVFIKDLKSPVKKLNQTVEQIIDDLWWEAAKESGNKGITNLLEFISGRFYNYSIKANACDGVRGQLRKLKVPCREHLSIKAGGTALFAEVDAQLHFYEDEIVLSAVGDLADGVRESYTLEKIELAVGAYIAAKSVSVMSDEVMQIMGKELTTYIDLIYDEANRSLEEGLLLLD